MKLIREVYDAPNRIDVVETDEGIFMRWEDLDLGVFIWYEDTSQSWNADISDDLVKELEDEFRREIE